MVPALKGSGLLDDTQIKHGPNRRQAGFTRYGRCWRCMWHAFPGDHRSPQDASQGLGAGRPSTLVGQRGLWAAGGLCSCQVFTEEVVLELNILFGFDCTESDIKTIQHHLILVDYEHIGVD